MKQKNNKLKRNLRPFIFIGVIALILSVVYSATKPIEYGTPIAPATGQLIENRPVMSSAFYTGKTAEAYRIAAEIPKIIDSQFCYCYCKKTTNIRPCLHVSPMSTGLNAIPALMRFFMLTNYTNKEKLSTKSLSQ